MECMVVWPDETHDSSISSNHSCDHNDEIHERYKNIKSNLERYIVESSKSLAEISTTWLTDWLLTIPTSHLYIAQLNWNFKVGPAIFGATTNKGHFIFFHFYLLHYNTWLELCEIFHTGGVWAKCLCWVIGHRQFSTRIFGIGQTPTERVISKVIVKNLARSRIAPHGDPRTA